MARMENIRSVAVKAFLRRESRRKSRAICDHLHVLFCCTELHNTVNSSTTVLSTSAAAPSSESTSSLSEDPQYPFQLHQLFLPPANLPLHYVKTLNIPFQGHICRNSLIWSAAKMLQPIFLVLGRVGHPYLR